MPDINAFSIINWRPVRPEEFAQGIAHRMSVCIADDMQPSVEAEVVTDDAGREAIVTVFSFPKHDGQGNTVYYPAFLLYDTGKVRMFQHIAS